MAESLLFRKGLLNDLETKAAKVAGAISITTDEPAIYIDVQEGSNVVRKRIGDFITFANQSAFIAYLDAHGENIPTTCLFYVEADNALMKYVKGQSGIGRWKQINSVSDVESDIGDLKDRVSAVEGDLTSLTNTVDDLADSVAANTGNITKNAQDISKNTQEISGLKTSKLDVDTYNTDKTNITGDISTLQGEVFDIKDVNTTQGTAIANLQNTVGDSENGLVKQVDTNRIDITNLKSSIGTVPTGTTVIDEITENAEAIEEVEGKVSTIEGQIININTAAEALAGRVDTAEENITSLQDNSATKEELTNAQKALNGLIEDNADAIDELETAVGTINNEITGIKNAATALTGRVGANETAISGLKTSKADVTYVDSKVKTVNDIVTGHTSDIADIKTDIGGLTQDITDLGNNKADITYVDGQIDTVNETVLEKIKAANAMTYKGGVGSQADLNKITKAQIGDTYVITAGFGNYTAGDFIIASGTEGTPDSNGDAYISGTITWNHVETGYIAEHESKLTTTQNTTKGVVNLTSYASTTEGDLGKVEIVGAATSNVVVSSTAFDGTKSTVTIGMAWGEF